MKHKKTGQKAKISHKQGKNQSILKMSDHLVVSDTYFGSLSNIYVLCQYYTCLCLLCGNMENSKGKLLLYSYSIITFWKKNILI